MRALFSLMALFLGIAAALALPDSDIRWGVLVHRSILTHGLLLPLLLFALTRRVRQPFPRAFVIGFSLASAVHLSFDLFPRAWIGFALIHLPVLGALSPTLSWLWIGGSIVLCLYVSFRLTRGIFEIALVGGGIVGTLTLCALAESALWFPLLALAVGSAVALLLPARPAGESAGG